MPIFFDVISMELPFSISSIGNLWKQESTRRDRGIPLYHWLQTETGVGEIETQGHHLQLSKGEGILISPFVPHAYSPLAPGWITSFITFDGSLREEIGTIVGHEPYLMAKNTEAFSFQSWVDQLIDTYQNSFLDPIQTSSECYAFLLQIARLQIPREHTDHHLYKEYVQPAIQIMKSCYDENLSIAQLSNQLFISPQYLTRLFQRFLGCATSQYLASLRINKAKELLVNQPSLEVRQVGLMVGFSDISHFIRVFRKSTGYTPREFRLLYIAPSP